MIDVEVEGGAALRVCNCFGFDTVIYHQGNSSGLTSAAVKVSTGAAFHLHIYHSNLNTAVRRLKDDGYTLYALEARTDTTIYDCALPDKFALIIGSEAKGVRHAIKRLVDDIVTIPMRGNVDSLNVSCVLSATLSEFSRRLPWPQAA